MANIFDSRQEVTVPLINGMTVTLTSANIGAFNYERSLLPNLISLGASGSLKIAPSVAAGTVLDVAISCVEGTSHHIYVQDSSISLDISAKYVKETAGMKMMFAIEPTSDSPAQIHSSYYTDLTDLTSPARVSYATRSESILGADVLLKTSDNGMQLVLKDQIMGTFVLQYPEGDFNFVAKLEGLGAVQVEAEGNLLHGTFTLKSQDSNQNNHWLLLKSDCRSIQDCKLTNKIVSPKFEKIQSELDISVTDDYGKAFFISSVGSDTVRLGASFGQNGKRYLTRGEFSTTYPNNVELILICADTLLQQQLTSLEAMVEADGQTECRLMSTIGEETYDGRVNFQAKEQKGSRVYKYSINTPIFSNKANTRFDSLDDFKVTVVHYVYPLFTFETFGEMSSTALAEYEKVKVVVARQNVWTRSTLDYEGERAFETKFGYLSENKSFQHHLDCTSPPYGFDFNYDLYYADGQAIKFEHYLAMADKTVSSSLARSILSPLSDNNGMYRYHTTLQWPQIDRLCFEDYTGNKDGLIAQIGVGQSAACYSQIYSDSLMVHLIETQFETAQQSDFDHKLKLEMNLEQQNGEIVNLKLSNVMLSTQTKVQIDIENPEQNIKFQAATQGLWQGDQFDFDGSVQVRNNGNGYVGSFDLESQSANIDESYELTGDMINSFKMAGRSISSMKFHSNRQPSSYIQIYADERDNTLIPVGIEIFYNDELNGLVMILPAVGIARLELKKDENEIKFIHDHYNQRQSKLAVNIEPLANVDVTVDIRDKTVEASIMTSSYGNLIVTPDRQGHLIQYQCQDSDDYKFQLELFLKQAEIELKKFYLSVGDIDVNNNNQMRGKSEILADSNGIINFIIDHSFKVLGHELDLQAGYRIPSQGQQTKNTQEAFKQCDKYDYVSYLWIEHEAILSNGIWITYDNNPKVKSCSNFISKDSNDQIIRQLIVQVDDSKVDALRLTHSQYGPVRPFEVGYLNTNDKYMINAAIDENTLKTEIDLKSKTGKVELELPKYQVQYNTDLTVTAGSIFGIEAKAVGTIRGQAVNLNKFNIANSNEGFAYELELDGALKMDQLIILYFDRRGNFESFELNCNGLCEVDACHSIHTKLTSQGDFTAKAEVMNQSLDLVGKMSASDQNLVVKADIANNQIDYNHVSTWKNGIVNSHCKAQINSFELENSIEINTNSWDFHLKQRDSIYMTAEAQMKGKDVNVAVDLDVSDIEVSLRASSLDNRNQNQLQLSIPGMKAIDLDLDFDKNEYSVKLGPYVSIEIDQDEFDINADIGPFNKKSFSLDGSGQVQGYYSHNSEWNFKFTNEKSVFDTAETEVTIKHTMESPNYAFFLESPVLNIDTAVECESNCETLKGNLAAGTTSHSFKIDNFELSQADPVYVIKASNDVMSLDSKLDTKRKNFEFNFDHDSKILPHLEISIKKMENFNVDITPYGEYNGQFNLITSMPAFGARITKQDNRLELTVDRDNFELDFNWDNIGTMTSSIDANGLKWEVALLDITSNADVDFNDYNVGFDLEVPQWIAIRIKNDGNKDILQVAIDVDKTISTYDNNGLALVKEGPLYASSSKARLFVLDYITEAGLNLVDGNAQLNVEKQGESIFSLDMALDFSKVVLVMPAGLDIIFDNQTPKLTFAWELYSDVIPEMYLTVSDFYGSTPSAQLAVGKIGASGKYLEIIGSVDIDQMNFESSGEFDFDSSGNYKIELGTDKLKSEINVEQATYSFDLTAGEGHVKLAELAEMKYEVENDILKVLYQCECLKAKASLDLSNYATELEMNISDPDYEIELSHSGLDLDKLYFQLTSNADLIFKTNLNIDNECVALIEIPYLSGTTIEIMTSNGMNNIKSEINFELGGKMTDLKAELELGNNRIGINFESTRFGTQIQTAHVLVPVISDFELESSVKLKINKIVSYEHKLIISDLEDSQLYLSIHALPLISGKLLIQADQIYLQDFNFNMFDIECTSSFDFDIPSGDFSLAQTLIRNGRTGEFSRLTISLTVDLRGILFCIIAN